MLKSLYVIFIPAIFYWPATTFAGDYACYLEIGRNQTISLDTLCEGESSSSTLYPFALVTTSPTTAAEQIFLTEYTVAFYAQDSELAQYAPTEAQLQGAFDDRTGFEEILDNAYRVCQGQTPRWQFPEFTELVFPGNTWTEFVQGLDGLAPLCLEAF